MKLPKMSFDEMMDYWFGESRRLHYRDRNVYGEKIEPRKERMPRGMCPYCKKIIGTGLYMHKKACPQRPADMIEVKT